jgi:hypothetical protein
MSSGRGAWIAEKRRQGRLGQEGDVVRIDRHECFRVHRRLDQRHRARRHLPESADHLGMPGMADEHDMFALRHQPFGLTMDLRHQRAGRVEIGQAAILRGRRHRFGHAVRGKHHRHALGHFAQFLDEHRALRAQRIHDIFVVDDLVPDIDRRTVFLDRQFDDPDRAVHARTEAARRGDQQFERWFRSGCHGACPTRLLARAKAGSYGARHSRGPVLHAPGLIP